MAEHASGRAASQLSSFTCFPHLPYDIRRLIWTAAARLPRNIDVWARQVGTFQYAGEGGEREKMFRYFTHQAAPGLLHASREARQVGLQHYVAGFSSCNEPVRSGQLSMTTPANIFFNPHSDRVCLMGAFDDRFFPLLLPPVNRVRNYQWSLPPPASVAVNIYSVFISVFYSEREFLLAFEGVPEALLYYWEPDDATSLGRHDSIEFVDYDDSLMEERGICAEIKAELQTLHSRQLNVKWATLVVNGQKVGMQ